MYPHNIIISFTGTVPMSEDIPQFKSVGITTTGHLSNLTLVNGQVVYVTVKGCKYKHIGLM